MAGLVCSICISASVSFRESVGAQKLLTGVKYIVTHRLSVLLLLHKKSQTPEVLLKAPYRALQLTLRNARYGQCFGWVIQFKMFSELLQLKLLPWEYPGH